MFGLLERWAALEPTWCRIYEDRIGFGPDSRRLWVDWNWDFASDRDTRTLQKAVIEAIEARNWQWTRRRDGSITVGHRNALHSVVLASQDFTRDLLNAYVQRLEMQYQLLVNH